MNKQHRVLYKCRHDYIPAPSVSQYWHPTLHVPIRHMTAIENLYV